MLCIILRPYPVALPFPFPIHAGYICTYVHICVCGGTQASMRPPYELLLYNVRARTLLCVLV